MGADTGSSAFTGGPPPSGNLAWVERGGEQRSDPPLHRSGPDRTDPAAPAARKLEAHGPQQPRRKWHGRWPVWERGAAVTAARAGNKQRGPHTLHRLLPPPVGSQGEAPTAGTSAASSLSPWLCLLMPSSLRAGLLASGRLPGAGEPPLDTRARCAHWTPFSWAETHRPHRSTGALDPGVALTGMASWPSLTVSIVTRVGPASLQPGGGGHVRLSKWKNHLGNRKEGCARGCGSAPAHQRPGQGSLLGHKSGHPGCWVTPERAGNSFRPYPGWWLGRA